VWQAGRGLAADSAGYVYVATASGHYDGLTDWGGSILKLAPRTLAIVDSFTPNNWEYLWDKNLDPSANGVTLIPGSDLMFAGGKEGVVYLLDQGNMGGLESASGEPRQRFRASHGCALNVTTPDCAQTLGTAYWRGGADSRLFVWDRGDLLRGYLLDPLTERFSTSPYSTSHPASRTGMTGGPTVSSSGHALDTAVVWAVTTAGTVTADANPGVLRAFSAGDLRVELYNSDAAVGDQLGTFSRMSPPVVANGRVYVPTQSGSIGVYGLLCQQDATAETEIVTSDQLPGKGQKKATYQEFRVTNTSNRPLGGPFALALDGLPLGVAVTNQTGLTACAEPGDSPYVELAGTASWLPPADSLVFRVHYEISGEATVNPVPRFLVGSGGR